MVNLLDITQMGNTTYLPKISQFLPIQDNQAILKSNGDGVVSQIITTRCNVDVNAHCNVDLGKMDGVTPLLNLCPSLRTIHPIKYHNVSFLDVYSLLLFVQHLDMSKLNCV